MIAPDEDGSPNNRVAKTSLDVGIACDFLFEGGAEMVIDALCAANPDSQIYTAIYTPQSLSKYPAIQRALEDRRIHPSPAQSILSLPFVPKRLSVYHFYWLYFLTSTFQRTKRHDIVFYSCAAQSKLIRAPRDTPVVVYFHTPTRWLYPSLTTSADLEAIPRPLRGIIRVLNFGLRPLDNLGIRRLRNRRVVWLCNSNYTRETVREIYGVECRVVHPPVDLARFQGTQRKPGNFFLYNGRITFQKRVDLAIRACHAARRPLVISGQATSPELGKYLQSLVDDEVDRDPSLEGLVTFLGRTSDEKLRELFAHCAALIFPPREDFGIAPIEAIASGVPVIAYKAGGALDYIQAGVNGRFFETQTVEDLAKALQNFDNSDFDPVTIMKSIPDLSVGRFHREIRETFRTVLSD
ncbi:MAG: glycosyltransferase [Paracoccaceae bacterium]